MRFIATLVAIALTGCAPAHQRTIEDVRAEHRQRQAAAERAAPFIPDPFPAAMISQALATRGAAGSVSGLIARRNGPGAADYDFCGDVTQLVAGTPITRRFFGTERNGRFSLILDDASVAPCLRSVVKGG